MPEVNDLNSEKILKEQAIREELIKNAAHYRNSLNFMATNLPIAAMCLPPTIEAVLLREGFIRIYDILAFAQGGHKLSEIKGIGDARARILESHLDEFVVVAI